MVFALGLALVVAESAIADVGPLPVPTPSLPALPALPPVPALPVQPVIQPLPAPVPVVPLLPSTTQAHSVSGAAPLGSGGRSAPTGAARGGRAAGPAASAPRGVGAPPPAARSTAGSAAARVVGHAAMVRTDRGERHLRRTVRRLRACLDGVPKLERRVLVLRSGLGPRPARSRAGVARVLEVSTARVDRLERRGLRRLRGLARGGCGGGRSTEAGAAAPATGEPPATGAATVLAAAPLADRIEVKGEQESGREPDRSRPTPARAPAATPQPPLSGLVLGRKGGTDVTLPLLALAALLAIAFAARGAIRSQRN